MDKVFVKGLRVVGRGGVGEVERAAGQVFEIDIEVSFERAGVSDDLGGTIDYDSLVKDASQIVQSQSFHLIETIAERIAERALAHPLSEAVVVRVSKPEAPIDAEFGSVGVEIRRSK